jgi:hypothetical protein
MSLSDLCKRERGYRSNNCLLIDLLETYKAHQDNEQQAKESHASKKRDRIEGELAHCWRIRMNGLSLMTVTTVSGAK